ncbi:ABC transporter permease [uncultured Ruegeria sp.]|uniref:ABC transporter permease n=1 Tax=uncultured Ruegeria sp. TaxID=259304 RepID=UPI0026251A11|nr:ABC transporter permease [uncultured Ruegeria sp.]
MNNQINQLILQRFGIMFLTLLILSFAIFGITQFLPGDVAEILLDQANTPEAAEALRDAMGLNEPAITRYLKWLIGLFQGDFGNSYVTGEPTVNLVEGRLANTLRLALVASAIAVPPALALGIWAALYQGTMFDRIISGVTVGVVSIPEFLVATMAVLVFAVYLKWLPALSYASEISSVWDMLRIFAMPVITLVCVNSAFIIRTTRAAVVETLSAPYCEMARLKGASRIRTVLVHALPNAYGPIANAIALSQSYLLGGVIIIETIFNYPGIARLMVDAVATRDLPLIQACAMIFCFGYLILTLIADVISILSNPRLRK